MGRRIAWMLGVFVVAFLLSAAAVQAANDYWTGNGATLGGSGTWDANTTPSWSPSASPSAKTDTTWDSSKLALFSGSAAGTVMIGAGGVSANGGIDFTTDGYTVAGQSLTLGGANAGVNTLTAESGVSATINAAITAANGFTKTGAGTLTLGGSNSISGTVAVFGGGTLKATNSSALGGSAVTLAGSNFRATAGTSIANNFAVAAAPSAVLISGYDFQTTSNGGTALVAASNTQQVIHANFGNGTLYLDGTNGGNSAFVSTGDTNTSQLGAIFGTSDVNVGAGYSTNASGAAALQLANASSNSTSFTKAAVFSFDASGYSTVDITFATQRSSSGFTSQVFQYSFDDINWASLSMVVPTKSAFGLATLSPIINGAGLSTVFVRVQLNGASSTGYNLFDNIQINGRVSPTTSTLGTDDTSGTTTFSGGVTLNDNLNLTAGSGAVASFTGAIVDGATGNHTLTKIGAGTAVFTHANTYSGSTTVSTGELRANNTTGSATGSSGVSVAAAARFSGNGTISGALDLFGTIAPGESGTVADTGSIGTLHTAAETWEPGGRYEVEINPASSTSVASDLLWMDKLTLAATSSNKFTIAILRVGSSPNLLVTAPITIAYATSAAGWSSDAFAITDTGGETWTITETTNTGGGYDLILHGTQATPELSSASLFSTAAATMLLPRRRRLRPLKPAA